MLYQTPKKKKYLEKIYANVVERNSFFFRRDLCVNNKKTSIKIVKIKSNIENFLSDLSNDIYTNCFVLEHTSCLTLNFPKTSFDLVGTNYKGVVLIRGKIKAGEKNEIDWTKEGVKNIWIFKNGWAAKLKINSQSIVSTKIRN